MNANPAFHLPADAELGHQPALPARYYVRSSVWGYRQAVPALVALAACVAGIGFAPLAWKFGCAVGVALAGYRLTFVVHDCSHRTLLATRTENEIVGRLASSLLFVAFSAYRRLHWQHHLHYRRPEDPQGHDYNDLVPGRHRVIWHLLKPLVLANLVEKTGAFFAMQHSGMTVAEQAGIDDGRVERPLARAQSVAEIAAAQAVVIAVTTAGFTIPWGYLLYIVPLLTLALFVSRVRSYLEHGSLVAGHAKLLVARTHRSTWLERNLMAGLNFNFHNEHHRWPQIPSRHLPVVHQEVTAGALAPHEYSSTYLSSLRVLLRACRRPDAAD
jgi:fatty acid desaturase